MSRRYWERRVLPGVVMWGRQVGGSPEHGRILPDGCLDLVWDGRRLFVAGPDTSARWHDSAAGTGYVALRFAAGTGAGYLGIRADELRDRLAHLDELWAAAEARELTERTAERPATALASWLAARSRAVTPEPLGARVLAMASVGTPVSAMADRLDLGPRRLHRRCQPLFGYGPRHLARVMRMNRALEAARTGAPMAVVAADHGYADQAHLSREVRSLAGATPSQLVREWAVGVTQPGRNANRSTGLPSGSWTTA